MNISIMLVLSMLFTAMTLPAFADIFRCKLSNGQVVYQETPCSTGEQKAIDDRRAKAQLERKLEADRELEESKRREQDYKRSISEINREAKERREASKKAQDEREQFAIDNVLLCKTKRLSCSLGQYRALLRNLSEHQVEEALGVSRSVQEMGKRVYWYYAVPVEQKGLTANARLQIVILNGRVESVNGSF